MFIWMVCVTMDIITQVEQYKDYEPKHISNDSVIYITNNCTTSNNSQPPDTKPITSHQQHREIHPLKVALSNAQFNCFYNGTNCFTLYLQSVTTAITTTN